MANKTPQDNALKHGLTSRRVLLPGEDPEQWEQFRQFWRDALQPANGPLEDMADRCAGIAWRLRRAERYQQQQYELDVITDQDTLDEFIQSMGMARPLSEDLKARRDELRGQLRLLDGKRADQARRYEISLERSLKRSLDLYRELQAMTAPKQLKHTELKKRKKAA